MSAIKEQWNDWKYLISKDNTTSRGFYLMITIIFAIIFLATIGICIFSLMGGLTGGLKIVGICSPLIAIVLLVLLVSMLSKG